MDAMLHCSVAVMLKNMLIMLNKFHSAHICTLAKLCYTFVCTSLSLPNNIVITDSVAGLS